MIKIYFSNRIIYLTDEDEPFYAHYKDRNHLKILVNKFIDGNYPSLFISHSDLNELFQIFKTLFIYEEAAGGLVLNNSRKVLAIKNRNVWQLPKGHVKPNESYTEAAIREVMEECNIKEPIIIEQLISTFHCFKEKDNWHLKRTYWFKMLYKHTENPAPLTEEGITEAKWVDKNDLHEIFENTYPNLIEIWDLV